METHVIRVGEADIVRRAPAHQAARTAPMARACAASWNEIACDLELLEAA
ncbi:hypothetical protein [Streptomyces sp. TE33382]